MSSQENDKYDLNKNRWVREEQVDSHDFGIEYERDVYLESAMDALKGNDYTGSEESYDRIPTDLLGEAKETREEKFSKLNLPEEEMLRTETCDMPEKQPEQPKNIDPASVAESIKNTASSATSFFQGVAAKASSFRDSRRRDKSNEESFASTPEKEEGSFSITHIRDLVRKEPELKSIEELKNPELQPYPIVAPKTIEVIQETTVEDVNRELKEAKLIMATNVGIPATQTSTGKSSPDNHNSVPKQLDSDQKPSWWKVQAKKVWKITKKSSAVMLQKVRESDIALQASLIGAGVGMIMLMIWKRNSFRTFRCIDDMTKYVKAPFKFHGVVHSAIPEKGIVNLKQLPFPRYKFSSSLMSAAEEDVSTTIQVSLLALRSTPESNTKLRDLLLTRDAMLAKVNVLHFPSDVNMVLPNNVVFGDILVNGFGHNFITRSTYHSISQYLVRMGECAIDREVNLDINPETKKYMKKLSDCEQYAVRRKLGMWEEKTNSYEDNLFVRVYYAMYRPLFNRFVLPRRTLGSTSDEE